jgi:hypoxanthine phosphoribosyltransferase
MNEPQAYSFQSIHPFLDFRTVGPFLCGIRKKLNLGQVELSQLAGVNQATISRLEAGEFQARWFVLAQVCKELGITPRKLLAMCGSFPLPEGFRPPAAPKASAGKGLLTQVISGEELTQRIAELAGHITQRFPVGGFEIVAIANAGVIFASRLLLELKGDNIGFHVVSQSEARSILPIARLNEPLQGRDVVVIDSIIRSGSTLATAIESLKRSNPRSISTCVLIDQYELRSVDVKLHCRGFVTEAMDLVGFGLDDHMGRHRNLSDIRSTDYNPFYPTREPVAEIGDRSSRIPIKA